jgi:hypothetical protein
MAGFTVDEIRDGPEIGAQNALLQASAYLEEAIHSSTIADTWAALEAAADRVHWALGDLAMVGNEDQLDAAQAFSATLDAIVALGTPPAGTNLATFQLQLLPLQTQIVEVQVLPARQWNTAQNQVDNGAWTALLGVFAAFAAVGVGAAYIDYKQSHGGYNRGARGVGRPIVAYRYPRH